MTLRETFAVAPGVQSARSVVLRSSGPDAYGRPQVDCLLTGRFNRKALDGVLWDTTESARIVNDISTDLVVNIRGQAKEMQPLDLSKQPDLVALIERVDLLDLVGPEA